MKHVLYILILFVAVRSYAQHDQRYIDSTAAVAAAMDDTDSNKVLVLNNLAWDVSYNDLDSGLTIANRSIALAQELGYIYGEAEALSVAGTIYVDLGRYAEAVDAHLRAVRLREQVADASKLGESYHNLALVYLSMDSIKVSLHYQRLAYDYYRTTNDSSGIGPICNYIGEAYLMFDSVDQAARSFNEGLTAARGNNYTHWIAANMSGLAYCAALQGEFDLANSLMNESFELSRSEKIEYNMMAPWTYVAKLKLLEKDYPVALNAIDSALSISTRLNVRDSRMIHLQLKAEIFEASGDPKAALKYYRQYQALKDSILSSKNQQLIKNLETVYEKEKTEKALDIAREDDRQQRIYVAGGIIASVGFVVIAFLLVGRIRMGKKAGAVLEQQKAIIELKNKDITDSINYARRIQDAVTPIAAQLKGIFSDAFVFNRPRSIVTGDFWWMAEAGDRFYIVTGDCSGHGVPGGFMSVMAASFLNGIIIEQKMYSPEIALFELNKKIRAALGHSGTNDTSPLVSDTIEIAICSFSKSLTDVSFSSAGMPVTLIRKHQLIEYRGSEFRAGAVTSSQNPFELTTTRLEKGDQMFLFSDGLLALPGVDQKHIQDLLVSLDAEGNSAVKSLDEFVKRRCGVKEQPDDVLVIGMKI